MHAYIHALHPSHPTAMRRGRNLALVVGLLTTGATADLFQLQDVRPTLAIDPGPSIDWASGGGAYALASTEAVRVNFRGVHTFARGRALRSLENIGWTAASCNASAWALCLSDVGAVFPIESPPRVPQHPADVPAGWGSLACSNEKGKVLVRHAVYDISACDVLDEGLDIVYSGRRVYHARTAMSLPRYWACVVLAIVLVRSLSHNVQALVHPTNPKPPQQTQRIPLAAAVALLVLTLLDLDTVFITLADQLFFWCATGYTGFYLAMHWTTRLLWNDLGETPVFNVIVSTLQMLATRLYTAAETPYNLLLIGMLACRVWVKLMQPTRGPTFRSLALTLDALYLSLCVELAFNGPDELVIAVFGVAYLCARLAVSRHTQD